MFKNSLEKSGQLNPIAETFSTIAHTSRMAILMSLLTACAGNDAPETLIFETRYQETPCEEGYEYCIKNLDAPKAEDCEKIKVVLNSADKPDAEPVTSESKIYPDGRCKAFFTPGMEGFEQGSYDVKIDAPKSFITTDCDGGSAVQAIEVWAGNEEIERAKNAEIDGREILNCIMPTE